MLFHLPRADDSTRVIHNGVSLPSPAQLIQYSVTLFMVPCDQQYNSSDECSLPVTATLTAVSKENTPILTHQE